MRESVPYAWSLEGERVTKTGLTQHVPAIRRLAERWLAEVADDPAVDAADGDFVCSPAGLWLALSAAAAGARAGTAEELQSLLGFAGPDAAATATAAADALAETGGLLVATGMWARIPMFRNYRESLPHIRFGHLDPNHSDALAAVDAWVRKATRGLISTLPLSANQEALLILVNVLSLKADWATPFRPQDTADLPFTDWQGVEHRVPTMFKKLPRPTHAWTAPGRSGSPVDVVALRCEAGYGQEPVQVSFVLGEPGRSAAEVLPAAWAPHELRRPLDADAVTFTLPRLRLRTGLDVARSLGALGMKRAVSELADFSGMSPEPLMISQIMQESLLKVNERGLEAAAVTGYTHVLSVSVRPAVIRHFAFDRPFGIVVFDGSGIPLFTAWQSTAPAGADRGGA
ncbi:serpin family protein [Streptomyces sp. NPDC059690]|uniref:serpin family protein n=1 Tax=Streptomyces sp. NPDC059690 TaxID=3346907 RepID=UPI0036CD6E2B